MSVEEITGNGNFRGKGASEGMAGATGHVRPSPWSRIELATRGGSDLPGAFFLGRRRKWNLVLIKQELSWVNRPSPRVSFVKENVYKLSVDFHEMVDQVLTLDCLPWA